MAIRLTREQFTNRFGPAAYDSFSQPSVETAPEPSPEPVQGETAAGGFLERTAGTIKDLGTTAIGAIKRQFTPDITQRQDAGTTALQLGGAGAKAIGEIGFDAIATVAKTLSPEGTAALSDATNIIFKEIVPPQAIEAANKGAEIWEAYKAENPRDAATLSGIAELAFSAPFAKGAKLAAKPILEGAEAGIEAGARGVQAAKGLAVEKALPGFTTDLAKIEKKIAPKMSKKETRKALKEDRLIPRSELSKRLGIKETAKASASTVSAAETALKRIPNASKLNRQKLFTAAKNEVKAIAKELEPELKKIKIDDQIKEDIITSWQDLKVRQLEATSVLPDNRIIKAQKQFENSVLDIVDAENVNDLWAAVKKYDDGVLDTIKNASSENQQALKELWLDNRRILRDAIDETALGFEDLQVSQSFKEMSDLYTVQTNILDNADFFKGNSTFKKALIGTGLTGVGAASGIGILF